MRKYKCDVIAFLLVLAIMIGIAAIPTYAISTSCVEDHFSMLRYDYDGTAKDKIRTPPSENSCPYTAMSMLLMFYDTYWNDRFVDFNYEWQPGLYDSFNDELDETFAPIEEAEDWSNYIDENISDPSQSDLYYKAYAQNHYYEFLESYLIWFGIEHNFHSDSDVTVGLTNEEMKNFLILYLFGSGRFYNDEVTLHYLHEDDGDIVEKMREQIDQGYPVLYMGKKIETDSSGNTTKSGHVLLAYGKDGNDIKLHTGWSKSEFQTLSSTQYNSNRAIMWIEINETNLPHTCSQMYVDSTDPSITYCACQIYSTHPNHQHINVERFDENNHWIGCGCDVKNNIEPHSYTIVVDSFENYDLVACECGYTKYQSHYTYSIRGTHYAYCICGKSMGIEHVEAYRESIDGDNHDICCGCGYVMGTEAHSKGYVADDQGVYCSCGYLLCIDHEKAYTESNSDGTHSVYCACGYMIKAETHSKSSCKYNSLTNHNVYCECGEYLGREVHVTITKLGKTYCKGCLHVFDSSSPNPINGSKDDPEGLLE